MRTENRPAVRAGGSIAWSLLAAAAVSPVWAGEEPPSEIQQLRERVESLERRERERAAVAPGAATPPFAEPSPTFPSGREPAEKPAPLRGVYDKPFLGSLWRRAHVGGYTEFEY